METDGFKITVAENGSEFLAALFSQKFDAVIVSGKELLHYNCNEKKLLREIKQNMVICSYMHGRKNSVKNIKIISFKQYDLFSKVEATKIRLKIFFSEFNRERKPSLTDEFIYKLPKKAGILLRHLILNKEDGITDEEISRLFWGNKTLNKKHCIYNHVYNLKKSLKTEFKGTYTIYKYNKRYRLIKLKKL